MDRSTLSLRRADAADLDYVERLLAANDLPTADVRTTDARFYVASDGDSRVGIGGLELEDTVGLLRSVVVEHAVRGNGVGVAICDELEAEARDAGVESLYLLTTTAADFFAGRGYETIVREDAPSTIQQTTEFADLCPASATCMRKTL